MDKREIRSKHDKKSKYNRGYKKVAEEKVEKEEKVLLPSNWSKYELSENNEDECTESANFDMLSKEPTSNYSFFKFKAEQTWDNDVKSHLQLSNYFMLDLMLLSEGTVCVPFSKRQDLDESLLSCTDSEQVNKNIERNLQNYTKYINKRFSQKKINKYIVEEKTEVIKTVVVDTKTEQEKPVIVDKKTETEQSSLIEKIPEEVEPVIADGKTLQMKPIFIETTPFITENKNSVHKSELEPKKTILNKISNIEKVNVLKEERNYADKCEDDMDELLNLKKPEHISDTVDSEIKAEDPLTVSAVTKTATAKTATDLEQWLDDILDD